MSKRIVESEEHDAYVCETCGLQDEDLDLIEAHVITDHIIMRPVINTRSEENSDD